MDGDSTVKNAGKVVRGAFVHGFGRVLSNVFGLFVNLLLTNALGAAGYGVFVYGTRIISVSSVFSKLGSGTALLRYVPKHDGETQRQNQIFGLVMGASLVASCLFSGILFVLAPTINSVTLRDPLFTDVLRVLTIFLPFKALTSIVTSGFRSLELLEYQVLIKNLINPVLRITAVGVALMIGASTVGVVAALVAAGIVLAIVAFSLLLSRTSLRPALGVERRDAREYFNYALPLTASRAGSILYNRTDVFMVGFFLSSAAVGVYGIAIMIASFLTLPLTAVNQLFPPIASDLYEQNAIDELRDLYVTTTRWAFTVAAFMTLGVVIYRREILGLFGEAFVAGALVILLYSIGKLTNAVVGPSGFVLVMTDHQYVTLANSWTAGVLNVILNYVFILRFGIIGAALGTATTEAVLNLTRLGQVWYLEGIQPYSVQFLKPLAATGVALGVMYAVRLYFDGIELMLLGGSIGGIVFLSTLIGLGLEAEDKQLLQRAWTRVSPDQTMEATAE